MLNFPSLHRVFKFELEALRGSKAAMNSDRTAEHQRALGEPAPRKTGEQIFGMAHRADRPFLIEGPLAADARVRTQQQPVPVSSDVVETPEQRRDRLLAHL